MDKELEELWKILNTVETEENYKSIVRAKRIILKIEEGLK